MLLITWDLKWFRSLKSLVTICLFFNMRYLLLFWPAIQKKKSQSVLTPAQF